MRIGITERGDPSIDYSWKGELTPACRGGGFLFHIPLRVWFKALARSSCGE